MKLRLLTDAQVRDFIVDGWMMIRAESAPSVHEQIVTDLDTVVRGQPTPMSGVVDRIPIIEQVYRDPAVAGALTSLLGPDFLRHPYTLSHVNPPGFPGQLWHIGTAHQRPAEIWRVMTFYFPAPVTLAMGPPLVVPGTQYRQVENAQLCNYGAFINQKPLVADTGDVAILHYDLWHRGSENMSSSYRYMVKAMFERRAPPTKAHWDAHAGAHDREFLESFRRHRVALDSETETYRNQAHWQRLWAWMHGEMLADEGWFPRYMP